MTTSSDDFDRLLRAALEPVQAELRSVREHVASLSSELRARKRKGSARARAVAKQATQKPRVVVHVPTELDRARARKLMGIR